MKKAETSPFSPWHWHRLEVLLQSVVSNRFVVLSGLGLKLNSAFSVPLLFYPSIIMCSEMVADLQVQAWDWVCVCPEHKQLCLPLLCNSLICAGSCSKLRGSSNPISLSEKGTGSWWLCSDVASTCIIIFGGVSVYLNGLEFWLDLCLLQYSGKGDGIKILQGNVYFMKSKCLLFLEFLCHSYILIRLKFLAIYLRSVCQCNSQLLVLDRTLVCVFMPAHTHVPFSLCRLLLTAPFVRNLQQSRSRKYAGGWESVILCYHGLARIWSKL